MATIPAHSPDPGNHLSAQEELADSLLRCMGRESAMHVCKMNGWAGVLEILMNSDVSAADESQ